MTGANLIKPPSEVLISLVFEKPKQMAYFGRSNLVGMDIIPPCFKPGEDVDTSALTGHEHYTIDLPDKISEIRPGQDVNVKTGDGKSFTCTVRFDTKVELAYFDHGRILHYVLRSLTKQ